MITKEEWNKLTSSTVSNEIGGNVEVTLMKNNLVSMYTESSRVIAQKALELMLKVGVTLVKEMHYEEDEDRAEAWCYHVKLGEDNV